MSVDPRSLSGVFPVFQTPYHDDESIDFATLDREIDWLFERGANALVMAMVSELLRLATDERERVAEHVCRRANGRGPVVINVGAESASIAERLARHAEACGAHAIMAIPPVSTSAPEGELLRYFERILQAVRVPMIIQDASGYVGRPLSIEFQARMFESFGDRILFKPEAQPLGPNLSALHRATNGRAKVFEGSGGIALADNYRRGIVGTMPGADLVDVIAELWKALCAGDAERIDALSLPLGALVSLQSGLDGFLAVEKYLLVKRGVFRNTIVRGPTAYRLDEETRREVDRLFAILMNVLQSP